MNKFLSLLLFSVLANAGASADTSCKNAMDQALTKNATNVIYQTLTINPVGNEKIFEVTAVVFGWNPNSAANSGYYYLVSATCKNSTGMLDPSQLGALTLVDDGLTAGGVTVKTISKQYY